ncbi:hypothetical protein Tco_1180334, partial [Tanacetum coccineum]
MIMMFPTSLLITWLLLHCSLKNTGYCLSERKRLESECEKQAGLLKAKDDEVENLKAQLLLKEAEATEATRLRKDCLVDQVHVLETTCSSLRDQEYLSALGAAISRAIEKGIQDGLSAGIDHGRAGRSLADVVAYNPSTEADYNFALQRLREVDFPLLAELKSYKDASVEDVMNLLRLEGPIVDALRMSELQPHVDQLMLPIHLSEDQVVLGEMSLSFALSTPLVDPLSVENLVGEANTSDSIPATIATTTALSTTFASASSVPPISIEDYEIV